MAAAHDVAAQPDRRRPPRCQRPGVLGARRRPRGHHRGQGHRARSGSRPAPSARPSSCSSRATPPSTAAASSPSPSAATATASSSSGSPRPSSCCPAACHTFLVVSDDHELARRLRRTRARRCSPSPSTASATTRRWPARASSRPSSTPACRSTTRATCRGPSRSSPSPAPTSPSSEQAVIEKWGESRSILTGPYAPAVAAAQARQPARHRRPVEPGHRSRVDIRSDGPHALVGGTTGAGKSEFLQAWVLGMAAAHSPAARHLPARRLQGRLGLPRLRRAAAHRRPRHRPVAAPRAAGARVARGRAAPPRAPARPAQGQGPRSSSSAAARSTPRRASSSSSTSSPRSSRRCPSSSTASSTSPSAAGRSACTSSSRRSGRPASSRTTCAPTPTCASRCGWPTRTTPTTCSAPREAAFFDPALPGRAVAKTGPGRLVPFQTGYAGGWTSDVPPPPDMKVETLTFGRGTEWEPPRVEGADERGRPRARPTSSASSRTLGRGRARRRAARRRASRGCPSLRRGLRPRRRCRRSAATTSSSSASPTTPRSRRSPTVAFRPDNDGNIAVYGTVRLRQVASSCARSRSRPATRSAAARATSTASTSATAACAMLEALPHVGSIVPGGDDERVTRLLRMLRATIDERAVALLGRQRRRRSPSTAGSPVDPTSRGSSCSSTAWRRSGRPTRSGGRFQWLDLLAGLAADGRPVGVHFIIAVRPAHRPADATSPRRCRAGSSCA